MDEETMTTPPSPTPTTANTKQNRQINNNNTDTSSSTTDNDTNVVQIISSHPRFSTSDIIQKFPHIQHRFCHKIKVSIPWKDETNEPNDDTYYKAICYFFDIVKQSDPQFQILTWNINNKECNSISDRRNIPHSHKDLSEYLYNLHITPSRIRTSMVITSSFNLGQPIRNQVRVNNDQVNLLKLFRKENVWVQPTTIQTMGEIKLIGFLQFVHPHCTNLKKLLIALQAIVETRDIVVELYRPRAVKKNNEIITAPEAIAIGAPSDISVDIYKSFIDKWTGVLKGHYDILIGKDSPLKDGYFIPFASGLLSQEDKNEAIIRHSNFMKLYTGFQLKRCSSVDVRFDLSQEETDKLGFNIKKDKKKRTTTLRRILESWSDESTDDRLIQSIDYCTATSHTLLIKASTRTLVNKKITELLEVLKIRDDFAKICGNKDNYGASVDRFSFSKHGQSYLTQLKNLRKEKNNNTNDKGGNPQSSTNKKRDRPRIDTVTKNGMPSQSISPAYKRGPNSSSTSSSDNTTDTSSSFKQNQQPNSSKSPVLPVQHPATKPSFQQIVKQSISTTSSTTPQYSLAPLIKPSIPTVPRTHIPSTLKTKSVVTEDTAKAIVPAPSNKVVTFVDSPNTTMTLSTITPDIISRQQFEAEKNILARLTDQKILDITQTVSERYDLAIQKMQKEYNTQIQQIMQKQCSQETEIESIKMSHIDLKHNLEQRLDTKMNDQTNILHSIVNMMKDIQTTNNPSLHSISNDSNKSMRDVQVTKTVSIAQSTPMPGEQDQDLSYSDTDSNPADGDETFTTVTVPSTINTITSQSSKATHVIDTRTEPSKLYFKGDNVFSLNDSDNEECKHVNKIDTSNINDIRKMTRTYPVQPHEISREEGWKNVTSKTKKSLLIKHAIVSPQKLSKPKLPDKQSPNYNRYVTPDSTSTDDDSANQSNSDNLEDCPKSAQKDQHEGGQGP